MTALAELRCASTEGTVLTEGSVVADAVLVMVDIVIVGAIAVAELVALDVAETEDVVLSVFSSV